MWTRAVVLSLVAATAAASLAAAPPSAPAAEARVQVEALRQSLEAAVSRAAGPGRVTARFGGGGVYHLPGYGAMVILSPRTLATRSVVVLRQRSESPAPRAAGRRARPVEPDRTPVLVPLEPLDVGDLDPLDIAFLERELQAQMAVQARAMSELERREVGDLRREIEVIQHRVELMREEADRVRALAEREVLVHLGLAPPRPPAAPAPPAAQAPPAAGAPTAVAPAPEVPSLPEAPPPPWRFWFETRDEAATPPDAVIASVRDAVAAGLESHRGPLAALRGDDWITTAVDFVPRLRRGPARTLQARVRVKDVQDRRTGDLGGEAFRKRIEFQEY